MDNDRAFTLYALGLFALVSSVLAASVASGIAALPSAGVFLEHLALSVGFRTAYKSLDGFDWFYALADALGLYEQKAAPAGLGSEVMA